MLQSNIPLKQALALVAVQQKRHDAQIHALKQKCNDLEQENELLKATRNRQLDDFLVSLETKPESDISGCCLSWMIALQKTSHRAELQTFLFKFIDYLIAKHNSFSSLQGSTQQTCSATAHLFLVTSPLSSLLQTIQDDMFTQNPQISSVKHASLLLFHAVDLINLYFDNTEEMCTEDDISHINLFIYSFLHASWQHDIDISNVPAPQVPLNDSDITSNSTHLILSSLVSHLHNHTSTQYLLLVCTTQLLLHNITLLSSLLTTIHDAVNMNEKSPQHLQKVPATKNNEDGGASFCMYLARQCQYFMHKLPCYACYDPLEHLSSISNTIWNAYEQCKIIALAHPEVAEAVQKCTAVLMQSLQHIAQIDDCPL